MVGPARERSRRMALSTRMSGPRGKGGARGGEASGPHGAKLVRCTAPTSDWGEGIWRRRHGRK